MYIILFHGVCNFNYLPPNHTYASLTLCCFYVTVSSCAHGLQRRRVTCCPDHCHRLVSSSLNQPNPIFIPLQVFSFLKYAVKSYPPYAKSLTVLPVEEKQLNSNYKMSLIRWGQLVLSEREITVSSKPETRERSLLRSCLCTVTAVKIRLLLHTFDGMMTTRSWHTYRFGE